MQTCRGPLLHIVSIALGGCLRGEPVRYGITEDTGGHITYILGEMQALARRADVTCAEIITRLFDAPQLGEIHAQAEEWLGPKLVIRRIDSGDRRYLAKEALIADRKAFIAAVIAELRRRPRLPDLIHAHFADAADVAREIEQVLGIPFVYTAHSLGHDKRATLPSPGPQMERRLAEEDRAIASARAVIGSSRDECERQLMAYPSARIGRIHRLVPGMDRPRAGIGMAAAVDAITPFVREPLRPAILAIARPVHKKNLVRLVEAFATTPALRERCNLVILAGQREALSSGEPEQHEVLSSLADAIDRHELYGKVAYPKTHSRKLVGSMYALAARTGGVFVNPALIEPYGLTLVEAAAHGVPVVATRVGGPPDILAELEHGLLVDPLDLADIGGAIQTLIEDKRQWQKCAANGLRGSTGMSWDAYADGFMRIAHEVLGENACQRPAPLQLVVSDLDNTLTGCDRGARRIADFFRRREGFGFVVATGRSIVEARRLVRDWRLPDPIAWITSVGTEIYLPGPDGLNLDKAFAARILHGWDPAAVDSALNGMAGLAPQPVYEQRPYKRSYYAAGAHIARRVEERLAEEGIAGRVVFSHERLLDVLPPRAGKAAAMAHVADHFGIPGDSVFAIGDSGNDADMLSACQNAILVGNHAEEVAALAQRSNVYLARRSHAAGALEGVLVHHRAQLARRRRGARSVQ